MRVRPPFLGGQAGFTLVEMLVALSIFAAIAAMGVTLLRSSIDTQDAVQGRLKTMGGHQSPSRGDGERSGAGVAAPDAWSGG